MIASDKLKRTANSALLSTLKKAGIFSLAGQSAQRRESLLILCYHGISLDDEHSWLPNLFITPEVFRQRLQSLRDMKASVLPLGEAITHLQNETLPSKSVVITFDDGFYDFYRFGVPLLKEFAMPATLYLTTYYCDYRLPIVNLALDYILWKSAQTQVEIPEFGIYAPLAIGTYSERQNVVWKILGWAEKQQLGTQGKDELARSVATKLKVDYDSVVEKRMIQIMSPEEAREIAAAGIDLQLHTHRHRTPRDSELFAREIRDNSNYIYDLSGREPVHFCYPSGDYAPEFLPWLSDLGVQSATTCERGLARVNSNPLLLPRVLDDSTMNLLRFESFVSGLFS
jgi:peptidoglycan/xylan/chitin deacetylase (PgdA/CDA1 family)